MANHFKKLEKVVNKICKSLEKYNLPKEEAIERIEAKFKDNDHKDFVLQIIEDFYRGKE